MRRNDKKKKNNIKNEKKTETVCFLDDVTELGNVTFSRNPFIPKIT